MADSGAHPDEFLSAYTDGRFTHCTRCGETLADMPEGYQISKRFSGTEPVYEFALCHPCHAGVVAEFSGESRDRLDTFHREHVSLNLGRFRCAVCGVAREVMKCRDYSITGAFQGPECIHELMFCGLCNQEMQSLMSTKTRQVWDRFVDDNLPGVPADSLTPTELVPA